MQTTIELRPMSVGDILDAAFRLYRSSFLTLLGISALLTVPLAIAQTVVQGMFASLLVRMSDPANFGGGQNPFERLPLAELLVFYALLFGFSLLQILVVQNLVGAAVVSAADRARAGTPTGILEAHRLGLPRFGALLLASLVLAGIWLVISVAFGACVFGGAIAVGAAGAMLDSPLLVGFAVLGILFIAAMLFIPMALFFYTRFAVVVPAIVLERAGPLAGLGRSWALTGRAFWKSLLIVVLLGLIYYGIVSVPSQMASFILTFASAGSPNLLPLASGVASLLAYLGLILVQPLVLLGQTFQYYDLRVRSEALDLELRAGEL